MDELVGKGGEWLKGTGPESDIVISSRIRLARNLSEFPFVRKCSDSDKLAIETRVAELINQDSKWSDPVRYYRVDEMNDLDRQFLVERQLISRELAESNGARSVLIDSDEKFSVMINEEDHLRITVNRSDLDLQAAWRQISAIDDRVESQLTYAFSQQLGYLTACPANVGTGDASECVDASSSVGDDWPS